MGESSRFFFRFFSLLESLSSFERLLELELFFSEPFTPVTDTVGIVVDNGADDGLIGVIVIEDGTEFCDDVVVRGIISMPGRLSWLLCDE